MKRKTTIPQNRVCVGQTLAFLIVFCSVVLALSPPKEISTEHALLGFVLVVIIWITTVVFSVPCHRRLSKGFDANVLRKLILTNWLRTALWSARSFLALYFINRCNLP